MLKIIFAFFIGTFFGGLGMKIADYIWAYVQAHSNVITSTALSHIVTQLP